MTRACFQPERGKSEAQKEGGVALGGGGVRTIVPSFIDPGPFIANKRVSNFVIQSSGTELKGCKARGVCVNVVELKQNVAMFDNGYIMYVGNAFLLYRI